MMQYLCRICGCYLDPGEGQICEDCQEKEEEKKKALRMRQHPQSKTTAGAVANSQIHNITAFRGKERGK